MWVPPYPHLLLLIFTIISKASCLDKSSLTFVIDNTLSMTDDIDQVKQSADEIIQIVFEEKASQIQNMVLVTINDPYATLQSVTQDRNLFKRAINALYVHNNYGNYDCAEMSMEGILLALNNSLPGSFLYVFTDASAKDYRRYTEVTDMCQKKQSQIVFVLTGFCRDRQEFPFKVYFDIAAACSGIAFYVDKDEVNSVLTTIKETIVGNKTVLTTRKAPPYVFTDIPFVIDDQTEYAIVTVSGSNVQLRISGPKTTLTNLMWLDNAKVVKLNNPDPGTYIATVYGFTETSVYIVGRTDFIFSHGFSTSEPRNLGETTPQPTAGSKTHLSVYITDPKHSVNILSAQILDMNERLIKELPLKRVDNDFYTTPLFEAPSDRFKVAVTGKEVRSGKEIKRIAKIPVTPYVIPNSAPVITSNNSIIYRGLEGDVALTIPCNVTGKPKPAIVWKANGAIINTNQRYSIVQGALVISQPKEGDSNSYTCEAKNVEGFAHATFVAQVDKDLDDYGPVHGVSVLKHATKKLDCGSSDSSESVRWFQEGIELDVKTKYLTLENFDVTKEGNYSCRVSSIHGSYTKTYRVEIGFAPQFQVIQEDTVFDWSGNENDKLDCSFLAKPDADIAWTFNGEELTNQKTIDLSVSGNWGHYTCNVTNVHGSIQKSFDVVSSACLLSKQAIRKYSSPLLLDPQATWPELATTTDYLILEPGQEVMLSCPNHKSQKNNFKNFVALNEINVTCKKQDLLTVGGKDLKVSDLQCAQVVQPSIVQEQVKCFTENSVLVRVGYDVHGFLETYQVCYDHAKNMPLYTRVLMTQSGTSQESERAWYQYPGFGERRDEVYSCGKSASACCYSKTQLVSARDVMDGPAQNSTYIDNLNSVPQWRCNTKTTWHYIEDMVRSQLDIYSPVVVWSGTHMLQDINGNRIPRFLWKVIRFDEDEAIALVYVNSPTPSHADILCKNTCADKDESQSWILEHDKHMYCCSVNDFLQAFSLSNTPVGENMV